MNAPLPKTGMDCAVEASGLVLRSYASWWKKDVDDAMPMFEQFAAAKQAEQEHDRHAMRKHLWIMMTKMTGLRHLVPEVDRPRFQLLLGAMVLPDGADLFCPAAEVVKKEPSP